MARTKKTAAKSADPVFVRSLDMPSLEKRVFNMDGAKIRNYDLYSLEKRIYDLEVNGGGGGGSGIKIETGELTAGANNTPVEVNLSEITGTPDLIICKCLLLDSYLNEFVFIRPMHDDNANAGNYWHNLNENNVYVSDMSANNNGVKSVAPGKFSFNTDGTFTGATITFTAYCWTEG